MNFIERINKIVSEVSDPKYLSQGFGRGAAKL